MRPSRRLLLLGTASVILLLPRGGWAADPSATPPATEETAQSPERLFGFGKQEIGIAVGYAFPIPVGATTPDIEDLQYVAVLPRWGIGLSDPVGGDAWYRGNFELLLEGTLLVEVEPRSGVAGGGVLMFRYNFLPGGNFIPFVEAGGGFLGLSFDVDGQDNGFNFSVQGGLGCHYFVSERTALTGEWRWNHISNANTHKPNDGLDSSLFLVGVSVFLE